MRGDQPKNVMPPPTETHTPANATEISNKSLRSFSLYTNSNGNRVTQAQNIQYFGFINR
jgi:hypothetical protein